MADQPTPLAGETSERPVPERPEPEHRAEILAFPGASRGAVDQDVRLRDVIGSVLREERRRQGRTLAEVADAAAVSVPYLSEVERGRKEVSSDVLAAIHGALGLELGDVLDRGAARLGVRAQRRGPSLLAA